MLSLQRQRLILRNLGVILTPLTLSSSANIHSSPNSDSSKLFSEPICPFIPLQCQRCSSGCHPKLMTSKLAWLPWLALPFQSILFCHRQDSLIVHPPWWNTSLTWMKNRIFTWPISHCSSPTYSLIAHLPPFPVWSLLSKQYQTGWSLCPETVLLLSLGLCSCWDFFSPSAQAHCFYSLSSLTLSYLLKLSSGDWFFRRASLNSSPPLHHAGPTACALCPHCCS